MSPLLRDTRSWRHQAPTGRPVRLLIVPGLRGSERDHWQSWIERQSPDARRISVPCWETPRLADWRHGIAECLRHHGDENTLWVAVAHSFGCLGLVSHLLQDPGPIAGALLVAPANPARFGLDTRPLAHALPLRSTLAYSHTDPWMAPQDAVALGQAWGSELVDLGAAGHVNTASGHGPWVGGWDLAMRQVERAQARTAPAPAWRIAV